MQRSKGEDDQGLPDVNGELGRGLVVPKVRSYVYLVGLTSDGGLLPTGPSGGKYKVDADVVR